jgi:hypothetical protein
MSIRETGKPLTSLLTQIISESAYLLQTEIRLVRAEVREKMRSAANGGVLLGVGAVIAIPGLVVLLLDIARWIQVAGLQLEWGLLIVGGVTVLAGVLLCLAGSNRLKTAAQMPERTLEQVRADVGMAKEQLK